MATPVLVTPPAPILTAEEAKKIAASLSGLTDEQVNILIAAGTAQLDGPNGLLKRCIGEQTWRQPFDQREDRYRLPDYGNVLVVGVFNGADALDPAAYRVGQDALGVYVETTRAITHIDFKAGFATVPQNIKTAVVLLASDIQAKVGDGAGLRSFEVYQAYTEQYSSPEVVSAATIRTVQALIGRHMGLVYA